MGKFDTAMFAMANAIKDTAESADDHAWRNNADYVMSAGERHTPDTNHKITLINTPLAGSVYIAGMEQVTGSGTITTGKYLVNGKDITFSNDDDITYVDVVYDYTKEVTEAVVTNRESAIGEAVCKICSLAA